MSLFDLPCEDVIYTHIFCNLKLLDIWNLRLISRAFHSLCWDYFIKACKSLSVTLQVPPSQHDSFLGVAAAINILSKCEKIRNLKVSQDNDLGPSTYLHALLCEVIRNQGILLKRVCFRCVDFNGISLELVDCLSVKFHELEEFELCGITLPNVNIIAKFIKHCKQCLIRLSINNLSSALTQPLSLEPFDSLKFLSVENCLQVSSEGCLEELFRKCPKLETVDLRLVKSVNDRTLLVLTEYCRHLRQLHVQGCTQVAMATLIKIHSEHGVKIDIELQKNGHDATRTPGQI